MINKNNVAREIWRVIDEYENYEVSSHGRVRNTDTMKIVKGTLDNGYYRIDITKNNKRITHRVHRLVAFAFCNNDNDYNVVDHIDRNPSNNHFLNLRWVTLSTNSRNKTMRNDNTSGIQGVSFHPTQNSWLARWYDIERNQCCKSFSIKNHGDQAKQLAINKRLEMESLYGYL